MQFLTAIHLGVANNPCTYGSSSSRLPVSVEYPRTAFGADKNE